MNLYKDKYISFIINNYRDIEALLEIYNHAKANIPSLIDREMKSCIEEIEFENVDVYDEEGFIWWCDPRIYNVEQDKGPYFSYEPRWNSLFTGNDPEDASFLYLYIDVGNLKQKYKKKEYIDKWIDQIKKKANKLKKQRCNIINPVDYEDAYLLKYSLQREINMESLSNREKFRETLQKVIKNFTENCLLILNEIK